MVLGLAILFVYFNLTAFCVLALPSSHSLTFWSECDDVLMLCDLKFVFAELAVVQPGQWRGQQPGACRPSWGSAQFRLRLPPDREVGSDAIGPALPPGPVSIFGPSLFRDVMT